MSSPKVTPLLPAVFGEAPHWCSERNELFYVDVLQPHYIHRYNPLTKVHKKVKIDFGKSTKANEVISVVIPVKDKPNEFIVTRDRHMYKVVWDGESENPSELKLITSVHDEMPGAVLNDGKCDKEGRLWIGSVGPKLGESVLSPIEMGKGHIFSLEKDLTIQSHVDGINISNGLTWSPDYKQMYYIDSLNFKVDAFDYDLQNGKLSNRRTIYDFKSTGTDGMPDGMTSDINGNIWVACFRGSQVLCINPATGEVKQSIKFPVTQVTSVIFGGPELDTLYVTSAKFGDEVANQEYAGYLFEVIGLGVKGIPSVPFGGKLSV